MNERKVKIIDDFTEAYEQGKADGKEEMWEKFANNLEMCESCAFEITTECNYNNCPIAKGGK